MNEARRRLGYWLLAALLERGADPVRHAQRHHLTPAHRVRILSRSEYRRLAGPPQRLRILPLPRPAPQR